MSDPSAQKLIDAIRDSLEDLTDYRDWLATTSGRRLASLNAIPSPDADPDEIAKCKEFEAAINAFRTEDARRKAELRQVIRTTLEHLPAQDSHLEVACPGIRLFADEGVFSDRNVCTELRQLLGEARRRRRREIIEQHDSWEEEVTRLVEKILDDLSEEHKALLTAMQREGATKKGNRKTSEFFADIVAPESSPETFKPVVSKVAELGLVVSRASRGGGIWLTPLGLLIAERLSRKNGLALIQPNRNNRLPH